MSPCALHSPHKTRVPEATQLATLWHPLWLSPCWRVAGWAGVQRHTRSTRPLCAALDVDNPPSKKNRQKSYNATAASAASSAPPGQGGGGGGRHGAAVCHAHGALICCLRQILGTQRDTLATARAGRLSLGRQGVGRTIVSRALSTLDHFLSIFVFPLSPSHDALLRLTLESPCVSATSCPLLAPAPFKFPSIST